MAMCVGQAHMRFPGDYPYSPPTVKFLTKMWHPNVYEACHSYIGRFCVVCCGETANITSSWLLCYIQQQNEISFRYISDRQLARMMWTQLSCLIDVPSITSHVITTLLTVLSSFT